MVFRRNDIDNERRSPRVFVKMKSRVTHNRLRVSGAMKELKSFGLDEGMTVVDFGCGSGIYTIAAAKVVGNSGTVHAVDLHPTLLEMAEKRALGMGLTNIDTIYSDLETGVDEDSVDIVIFYNVLTSTRSVRELLFEANRIIKEDGTLLIRQSGMTQDKIKVMVLKDGFFSYLGKRGKTMKFKKIIGAFHEIS